MFGGGLGFQRKQLPDLIEVEILHPRHSTWILSPKATPPNPAAERRFSFVRVCVCLSVKLLAVRSTRSLKMTKQEIEAQLKEFGTKGKKIAAEIYDKIETEKESLDTESRRKVRGFWIFVSALTFAIGFALAHYFF
nr:MAG TPA: hypothetical protein [Caudoviricetes sp.]